MLVALKTECPPRWLGWTISSPSTPILPRSCQDWNLTEPIHEHKTPLSSRSQTLPGSRGPRVGSMHFCWLQKRGRHGEVDASQSAQSELPCRTSRTQAAAVLPSACCNHFCSRYARPPSTAAIVKHMIAANSSGFDQSFISVTENPDSPRDVPYQTGRTKFTPHRLTEYATRELR